MKFNEMSLAVGYVRLIKRDASGLLLFDQTFKNQLTNYARYASAQMWTGTIVVVPSQIQVGNGTIPSSGPLPTDTALWSPMTGTLKQIDYATTWLSYNTQYAVTYDVGEANGQWTELGLFDAAGNLWSHIAVQDFSKDTNESVTVQWQVTHLAI